MEDRDVTQASLINDVQKLAAERDALLEAADAVSQGIIICDGDGEIIYESPSVQEWLYSSGWDGQGSSALQETLLIGRHGRRNSRSIELLGPPLRSLMINCAPIVGPNDEPQGAVAVLVDTTEGRHHEALMRDFVANVSHELKTPVGALGLLAEALQVEKDPTVIARLLARMQIETTRVTQVIDDLLNLSSVEAVVHHEAELIKVSAIIGQAQAGVRYIAEHRSIDIEIAIDGEPTIYGSMRHLVSAVHHLLENAVKYSSDHSEVLLKVASDGDWTTIELSDNGIGIPSKYIDRVFERFFRVDDARKRSTGGTGLGLAIVRQAIQRDGGEIRVISREGQGTTFIVRLPAIESIAVGRRIIEGGKDG